MTNCELKTAITNNNEHSLQRLIRAINLSKGEFSLILVRCNYRQLREEMRDNLRDLSKDINIRELYVQSSISALHTTITSQLFLDNPSVATDCLPSALMVFGLESVIALEDLLTGINQSRDIYAASFPFPLILWLQDEVASLLSRLAPDFKSWAATTIKFEMPQEDLIALITKQTESLFSKVLEVGAEKFISNDALDLAPKSQHRHEIESARNDLLRSYNVKLEPGLEASLEFVLGRDKYANDQINSALAHYQRSLSLWQQEEKRESLEKKYLDLNYQQRLWQAIILFHLGLCYHRMADLHQSANSGYWRHALQWFQQCLDVLEEKKRQDLVAKFILPACEMLYRLQLWEELKKLAQKSLYLHKSYGNQSQIAQDYGFLSAVAGANHDWILAHELANTALDILEKVTGSRQHESWYLLLLARSQRHLGECEEAISNLEWARVVCELQYEPSLYLEILEELRSLYFIERHEYLEAFKLKQEKIQIEHQYGLRAFIGASQLQAQRYKINSVLEPQSIPFIPEEVAQEISASGRQQDVNRLIERITRADYKLTVVHGPSGVGKSSLLKAGLLPAVKNKVIGERIPLPIVLSAYTDWINSLGRSFYHALAPLDISSSLEFTPAILLEKLRSATVRNHTIIIIFDQFEEFFFVSSFQQKLEFYQFFSECLNIAYLKIIISIREDYLHYLLDFERWDKTQPDSFHDLDVINKNILDKDIRYFLGKFSYQDAVAIIRYLTQTSQYEVKEDLINELVRDLAGENEEVNPIELQIVGAQLQAENITNLEKYKLCGGTKKLIERWLEEVIRDCGQEHEDFSWKLLYELTDEKGTRPLKTKSDLILALEKYLDNQSDFDSRWELILEILIGSGLVLCWREELGDRYQLVHDYLVEPIRQRNDYGIIAELEKIKSEKTKAEVAQKLSQEQLNSVLRRRLREARAAGVLLAVMGGTIASLWWQADMQKRTAELQTIRAETSETNLQISAIAASSEALFSSNQEFDALLESLRAWQKLKQAKEVRPETRMRVVTALQQAVYGVTELNRLEGHSDIVWGVAFSPDGQLLASGSTDRTIKLWRPDGTLIQTLEGHTSAVTSVSFSPDGQTIASTSLDQTVRIWRKNPTTGEFAPELAQSLRKHKDWVYSANFSPDGELLATASRDKTIKIWDRDGNLIKTLKGHQGSVNWVSFSPDSQFIASASEDKTVKIWRRDGSLVKTLSAHQEGVTVVTFSPDGKLLASADRDNIIQLWQWDSSNQNNPEVDIYKTLQQHTSTVWSLNFSSDSKQLASASDDNTINLWSHTGNLIKTFKGHSDAVVSVAFSPDTKMLASGSYDKSVKLWSLEAPKLPILRGHEDRVLSVAWSPDGQILASGSRDRTVKLWRRQLNQGRLDAHLDKTLVGHTQMVHSVSIDPKGEILASASEDKTVKLWRLDGTLLKTLSGHGDSVVNVNFSPDGNLLASASRDHTIKLWNRDGSLLKTLVGHEARVNSVSFSPDGEVLASASDDKTIKLWRPDGSLIKTFEPHDSWVLGVSFSPTEKLLASAGWDNTVRLWRQDGTLLQTLLRGFSDSVNAVSFSPTGEILAAANWDSTVKLWSREGKLIKTLNGHEAPVLSVSFSPDGQTLASASDDNTIILWNLHLDDLLTRGCGWVNNYLKHNNNVDERDRLLCDDVSDRI
ncbi:hypothetical protein [Nostoc parmelioides]|uniref:Novel STAND NTPase 1 domain-containing protein n=1 Tax=Nostoc parmelioides FACHB-3921 TaxID=2692909 RepID=A0ABR8BNE8_9NOSO|nr:hypothetical protein [Nostoc parmelioides]MBD2255204.1 hypothetical protein [Nostoc parmelioides FACHB-3921]